MDRNEGLLHHNRKKERTNSDMSIMRIAIAGTGGLARLIARRIEEDTSHHVILLSRNQQSDLSRRGDQIAVVAVDYNNATRLDFALHGIDTVISTVTGPNQEQLLAAALRAGVRRFAPAEFEGPPQADSRDNPLDRGRWRMRQLLARFATQIESTIFVCGILYERFQFGGLGHSQIRGANAGLGLEGAYVVGPRASSAQIPSHDPRNPNTTPTICMTAAQDVAELVCRALDLLNWPPQFCIHGQRISVYNLVMQMQALRDQPFNIQWHTSSSLHALRQVAHAQGDQARFYQIQALINTLDGQYDFDQMNVNQFFPDLRPIGFATWLQSR